MANVLGTLFGEIAQAIREKTGDTQTMKPAEFPDHIRGIEASAEGVDPYYQQLAEAVILRQAKYLSGDDTVLSMKGFVTSDGTTLGNIASYAFAGFDKLEGIALSDIVMVEENAFVGNEKLKIIDFTVTAALPQVSMYAGALNGCTTLDAVIIRNGSSGLTSASIPASNGANNTFYVYVPSAYYDTVVSKLASNHIYSSRYRKLEDYPAVDNWNTYCTVNFYDGDTLVETQKVKWGETATPSYKKENYVVTWSPSNENITQDTDCYAQFTLDAPFATASYSALGEALRSGSASTVWSVGDTRNVPITLYDGTAITTPFEIREVSTDYAILVSRYAFAYGLWRSSAPTLNTTDTNYWGNSSVRTCYNNDIFGGLPEELQTLVSARSNTYYRIYSGSYITSTSSDKLWIPGRYEIEDWYPTVSERKKCQQTASAKGTAAVQYALRDQRNATYVRPTYVSTDGAIITTGTGTPYSVNVAPIAMMLKVTE